MKLRKIELSELECITNLLIEQCPERDFNEAKEHTEWHLKAFPELCIAAEENKEILGFIISHLHENALEIEELYVKKGQEETWKLLIKEVLNKIPKVDNITMEIDIFKELIKQLK